MTIQRHYVWMTKKDNKRYIVRQVRRVLNQDTEFNQNISGHKLYSPRYGCGLSKQDIRIKVKEEEND